MKFIIPYLSASCKLISQDFQKIHISKLTNKNCLHLAGTGSLSFHEIAKPQLHTSYVESYFNGCPVANSRRIQNGCRIVGLVCQISNVALCTSCIARHAVVRYPLVENVGTNIVVLYAVDLGFFCNEYDIWNLSKELYDRLVSYTEDECEEVCGNDKWWVNVDD